MCIEPCHTCSCQLLQGVLAAGCDHLVCSEVPPPWGGRALRAAMHSSHLLPGCQGHSCRAGACYIAACMSTAFRCICTLHCVTGGLRAAHLVWRVSLSAALSAYACISSSPVSTCCAHRHRHGRVRECSQTAMAGGEAGAVGSDSSSRMQGGWMNDASGQAGDDAASGQLPCWWACKHACTSGRTCTITGTRPSLAQRKLSR